jgi:hypothetical protein
MGNSEFAGSASTSPGPPTRVGLHVQVWTEDVPLRALWKEFQACEAQLPPRLPCMVQLDQQPGEISERCSRDVHPLYTAYTLWLFNIAMV